MSSLTHKFSQLLTTLNDEFVSHPVTQNLWSFYQSRAKQEQLIIRVGLFVLAIVLLWSLFLGPLAAFADRAQQKYITASADYQWMQSHRDIAQQAAVTEDKTIEVLVKESPLAPFITQLTADDENRAALTLTAAPFNLLAESLAAFSRKNAIQITSATINRLPSRNGYVSASLVLERN
jgi:type II secretory pathway component PulM